MDPRTFRTATAMIWIFSELETCCMLFLLSMWWQTENTAFTKNMFQPNFS